MNLEHTHDKRSSEINEEAVCPACGHLGIETFWVNHLFPYGIAPNTVELDVRAPVRKCIKCGFEFFDSEAEDLEHDAVCRHLRRLTPKEVQGLREKLALSRAEMAELTGIGEATLARTERGESIQNASIDNLLRLLHFEDNVNRLPGAQQDPVLETNDGINQRDQKSPPHESLGAELSGNDGFADAEMAFETADRLEDMRLRGCPRPVHFLAYSFGRLSSFTSWLNPMHSSELKNVLPELMELKRAPGAFCGSFRAWIRELAEQIHPNIYRELCGRIRRLRKIRIDYDAPLERLLGESDSARFTFLLQDIRSLSARALQNPGLQPFFDLGEAIQRCRGPENLSQTSFTFRPLIEALNRTEQETRTKMLQEVPELRALQSDESAIPLELYERLDFDVYCRFIKQRAPDYWQAIRSGQTPERNETTKLKLSLAILDAFDETVEKRLMPRPMPETPQGENSALTERVIPESLGRAGCKETPESLKDRSKRSRGGMDFVGLPKIPREGDDLEVSPIALDNNCRRQLEMYYQRSPC